MGMSLYQRLTQGCAEESKAFLAPFVQSGHAASPWQQS